MKVHVNRAVLIFFIGFFCLAASCKETKPTKVYLLSQAEYTAVHDHPDVVEWSQRTQSTLDWESAVKIEEVQQLDGWPLITHLNTAAVVPVVMNGSSSAVTNLLIPYATDSSGIITELQIREAVQYYSGSCLSFSDCRAEGPTEVSGYSGNLLASLDSSWINDQLIGAKSRKESDCVMDCLNEVAGAFCLASVVAALSTAGVPFINVVSFGTMSVICGATIGHALWCAYWRGCL